MNKKSNGLKFIDFCAGIGAGRIGLENTGMKCVGFSEIDKHAEKTYRSLFGKDETNYGDLMKINHSNLPNFDLMIAGFPCQTFSVIGQRAGMSDDRGQIIYGLIKIIKGKNLKYFILENVKGLLSHDKGRSMKTILDLLDKAGYKVFWKLLNSIDYGVPQMRERVYFVGVRKDLYNNNQFTFPSPIKKPNVSLYLIDINKLKFNNKKKSYNTFLRYLNNKYNNNKFSISELLKDDYLVLDTRQSDLRLYKNRVPTLRTGRHGIMYVKQGKFRKLSGYEALLLQGFPIKLADKVRNVIPNSKLLGQAGNAMTVSTIENISKQFIKFIGNP